MNLDFSKGIHTNTKPINTPAGYYRDAENMRVSGGSMKSEEGTLKMSNVPSDFTLWGNCSIGDESILLGEQGGKSIIGALNKSDQWTVLVPARAGVDILGIFEPTQVEGKKNWAGERVIYFSTLQGSRRINLDKPLPTTDIEFDKVTSLFLEFDLPKVSYLSEQTSGSIPSGVYQLAARLVTESGASTSFGIISEVISIVPSSLQSPRGSIIGAPPQTPTSKSIEVQITNVDIAFKYIELGILTYIGIANTPVLNVTNRIPINSQPTIKFTYRGAADHFDTLPIEEFIVTGVSYLTGKFLTQKDGSLLIGAPTEAAQPPIDWYRVAAGITADFIVKSIPFRETLKFEYVDMNKSATYNMKETSVEVMDDGYKNPVTCALYKGYRRDEVYAFSITPVFISGVYGPTVHIPAKHTTNTPAVNSTPGNPDLGGTLGTYISEEKYVNDTYPGITSNHGLRLHKFPNATTQPLVSGNVETNNMKFRVLGVKFGNIVLHSSELQYADQIAGFIIGRVNRTGNETQLAQGIVRPHTATIYGTKQGFGTLLGDGFVQWETNLREGTTSKSTGTPILSSFNFLAPDIIHGLYSVDAGSYIKQHSIYKANPYASSGFHIDIPERGSREGFGSAKCFFKNITGETTTVLSDSDSEEIALDGLRTKVGAFGVPLAPAKFGGKVETFIQRGSDTITMCSSDGFVWMGTLNATPIKYLRPNNFLYRTFNSAYEDSSHQKMENVLPLGTKVDFVLHSLTRRNNKQYGPLDQMVSMFVNYTVWKNFTGTLEFFNGDTFINKYGLTINDEANFPYSTLDDAQNPQYQGFLKPPTASGIVYFWLESSNNYAYRHYIQPTVFSESNIDSANGSTPFFPTYKQLISNTSPFGLLSMHAENWVRPGYASQYNNHYSAQSTFKPYVNTPKEDTEFKASLTNRIIYSVTAVQGEKSDAYQIFLPNNYYDVPQEYGDLTDIYVNGELFAATNQVQWRLFFNTLATQTTNVGEIVLGTGGAFNRPAVPMATVDGGYGGYSHWLHAINTIFGRIFVDKLQGRFFLMQEQLVNIVQDLNDTDRLYIQALNNTDILVGSEPLRERVFIKVGTTMWSYHLEERVYKSRHTYVPRWMFSHGPHMYSNQMNPLLGTTGIFKHSVGPAGVFYGKLHPASITLIANVEKTMSKEFKSLEILSKRTREDGTNKPFDTFNQLVIWNDERYSGINTITPKTNTFQLPGILEVLASKVKDSFRISIPRDIVKDPNINIFTLSNHAQTKGDSVAAKWLPKMKGTYIQIKLITDNTQGPIYLFDVGVELTENIR